jgi:hypothetical protein
VEVAELATHALVTLLRYNTERDNLHTGCEYRPPSTTDAPRLSTSIWKA